MTDSDTSKVVILDVKERTGKSKLIEDAEYKALFDEDLYQTQEELAESLGVAQLDISMCLKALEVIQKQGNWVLYELKPRDLKKRFLHMNNYSNSKNERFFALYCY